MEWNINDVREQAALQAAEKVDRWKETMNQRLFGEGGKKPTKRTNSSSGTSPETNKKKFQAKLTQALRKHPEYNTPEWILYFTTIADLETGGTFNENAMSKNSSAQGYFQILKASRKTGNQFEDMFNLTASNQKALVRNFGQEGIKKLLQQGYTMPELMVLSHFQGASGAATVLRGGKGRRDANGVTPNRYLDIFRSKWPGNIAGIPTLTVSPESIRQQLQTPVTPNDVAQLNPDGTVGPVRELDEVLVIGHRPTPNLAMSEIPDDVQYDFELTPTQTLITPIETQFADINDIFKQQLKEEIQNILLQDPALNTGNSVFKYALAEDPQEKARKLMEDIAFQEQLNQAALGGPLFNSRTPIESFQGKKAPLPIVRYDEGGEVQRDPINAELPEVNVVGHRRPAILMYDKNTGEYSRGSTGDILTPINTSISDNPADWTYQDKNGTFFIPDRQASLGEITQGQELNGLDKLLLFSNQHYNDPIMGAAARWSNDWHNDRNPIKAAINYFDPTGLVGYGIDKGIDLYNKGTDALGMDDAMVAGLSLLPIIGKGMLRTKKFTSLLDWSPENYFGKIGRHNRTRVDGSFIEPDAEDIKTLESLVPEYNKIEEQAVKNGDFILDANGNYTVASEPSMSPYEYILRHSKNGQKYRQEHAYTGVSEVHKDAFLNNSQDHNVWTSRTKPLDVEEYASVPLGGEVPYTAERKALRVQKYLDKVNRYQQLIDLAKSKKATTVILDNNELPIDKAERILDQQKRHLLTEINEPLLHGGSVYDVTIPNDVPTHNWGNAGGAKWSVLPLDGTEKMSLENEIQSEIGSLQNYLSTLDSNSSIPEQSRALIKSSIETKLKELQSKLANKDFYYEKPRIISTDAAVARDANQGIGNTMIDNVMDTYNGTMLDESIYHAGVPKKVWLGNNGALDRASKSPLKSLLLPIVSTSTVAPFLMGNDRALGGTLTKGQQLDLEQDLIDELIKLGYKIRYIK